ncbi:hypothetical protein Tco_1182809 [Tanacetum coccineum]
MVGSLIYLIASITDLYSLYACVLEYQAAMPTKSTLKLSNVSFVNLKGTNNIGFWYPKDNAMSLTVLNADADHARWSRFKKK